MVMFFPINHEIDCISRDGRTLGRIKFDGSESGHVFQPDNDAIVLSNEEKTRIAAKLAGLDFGKEAIPMPDDD